MRYGEFISIFNKDYNLDYFYAKFLKKKKKIKKILNKEADNNFLEFLLKNDIEKEEEIKIFFKLYNYKFNLDIIYFSYDGNFVNLKDLENIKNMDDFKYVVLNKYKDYLRVDIDKINDIDLENIIIFLKKYPEFYKYMKGNNKYSYGIKLYNEGIKKDLTFLRMLGIEEVDGFFNCSYNSNLKSLKGSPRRVNGIFDCSGCGLEELGMQEGVEIGRSFICSNNKNLKSLKGCPSLVKGDFYCDDCDLNEIDLDKGIVIEGDLICLEDNKVTKKQVEEYVRKNNIILGGEIL